MAADKNRCRGRDLSAAAVVAMSADPLLLASTLVTSLFPWMLIHAISRHRRIDAQERLSQLLDFAPEALLLLAKGRRHRFWPHRLSSRGV